MLFSFLFYNRTFFSSNTQRSLPEASYNSFVLLLLLLISNQLWLLSILPKNVLYSFFTEMPLQYYNRLGLGLDISLSRQIVSTTNRTNTHIENSTNHARDMDGEEERFRTVGGVVKLKLRGW